jgi:hexosaminidase
MGMLGLILAGGLAGGIGRAAPAPAAGGLDVMPLPASVEVTGGRLAVTPGFAAAWRGCVDPRVEGAFARLRQRWEARTGLAFAAPPAGRGADAALIVECDAPAPAVPRLGEDESYTLDITPTQAVLRAPTTTGALRGLATLEQLLTRDAAGWSLPAVKIRDQPRFPWRGLLIDVCRHWQPLAVIERNLDAMALVKLNVLHLHLTDDQGFRIESRRYPRLQETASDGHYFTQAQMRELIAYAAARGIRVVPEFDLPGHATSWVVAYPGLASAPGPYQLQRTWGVFDPVLDPTNEHVYELLDGFLGEMAALFPDAYVHIGGDENNGKQWDANPGIQAFIREHRLGDDAGLQAYFNRRLHEILARHGRKMMGWEEILYPGLPTDCVVQSWRGDDTLAAAARQGYGVVLSRGYYIDLMQSAAEHYAVDPDDGRLGLSPAQRRLILGGEATMWSEWVSSETIDSRIWPRTAAIAERLWSPATVTDVADMYRRLDIVDRRLEETGLLLAKHQEAMLRRLAGGRVSAAAWEDLRTLAAVVEPAPIARRRRLQRDATQSTPLTGLVDCVSTDSEVGRQFSGAVEQYLGDEPSAAGPQEALLARRLEDWSRAGGELVAAGSQLDQPQEVVPVARALADVSRVGAEALAALAAHRAVAAPQREAQLAVLAQADRLPLAVRLSIVPAVKWLVLAAGAQEQRAAMSPQEWRRYLEGLAGPGADRKEDQP